MSNRQAVTIRFNQKKQNDLRWLMEFYDFTDSKQAVELAFDQLLIATRELAKKLKEQENAKQTTATTDAGGTDGSVVAEPSSDDNSASAAEATPAAAG